MAEALRAWFRRLVRRAKADPYDTTLALGAVAVCAWVLVVPFTAARYPPITDLPMHASSISAFRHWLDPSFHFRDQFELHPLEIPYLTQYTLGALLALVLPIGWAVKLSTSLLLALLPAGLAVYFKGLHKSPLLGLAGAGLTWGTLTHWGFINSLAGVGLMMMGIGVALMQLEAPSRRKEIALAAVSLLLFFTHVFRFPFYCVALALAALLLYPANKRLFSIVRPLVPSVALFVVWWFIRPKSIEAKFDVAFHPERTGEIGAQLLHSFAGPEEPAILATMGRIVVGVAVYSVFVHLWERRAKGGGEAAPDPRARLRVIGGYALAASVALMFLGLFFWLPMSIGFWWYVYPREISVAVLAGLALMPDLPRTPALRVPAVAALAFGVLLPARFVTREYERWDALTGDFQQIVKDIPKAPKLAYVLWDLSGSDSMEQPFLHLPAWVQAEEGGWLSFHFATWNASPLRFRTTPPMDVAPDTPLRFEWHPEWFDLSTRGKYFDWFLIRSRTPPDRMMAADPTLERVDRQGTWWLYHRKGAPVSGP